MRRPDNALKCPPALHDDTIADGTRALRHEGAISERSAWTAYGYTIVEFCSDAMSVSVCRQRSLTALRLAIEGGRSSTLLESTVYEPDLPVPAIRLLTRAVLLGLHLVLAQPRTAHRSNVQALDAVDGQAQHLSNNVDAPLQFQ